MPELNEEDRERWFAACNAVTDAQATFDRENRRYFPAHWAGEKVAEPEPLDADAWQRLGELLASVDAARGAREQIGRELESRLG